MYRFTRLLFGVNCAPEAFQKEMCRLFSGMENVIVYIDDILIYSDDLEKLRVLTAQVLEVLRKNNLTLNTAKCEYEKTRITFLGHELDSEGFQVDAAKVKDIRTFRRPETASELRSFLGLASFMSPYIKNFADVSSPLWAVSTKTTWKWGPTEEKAFHKVKERIAASTTTLGYFSDKDRTILYTDASPNALGAVLVQQEEGKPPRTISFASKALTSTEKKYPQNHREALAAVWAVEHFYFFLLGRHFTLRTDAKGITFILNRCRENSKRALTRADGWALRLTPYSYDVEFIRGTENIADPSSRLHVGVEDPFDEQQSPWEIATLDAAFAGFLTEQDIREATARDALLQEVIDALATGVWPNRLNRFKSVAGDLSVEDGILVKTGCAVVPAALQEKTLGLAHEGHPMAHKMKSIMRERVWWPGMPTDVEKWVQSCKTCAINGPPEKTTPMRRTMVPQAVWESLALDFNGPYARLNGISILLIVDYRSRYVIARPVKSTSFEETKRILEELFDREGLPKSLRSDNGPPFNGEDYKEFCIQRGIKPEFSTPLFPQQNGLAESCMKLVNKAMAAAFSNGTSYKDELRSAVNAYNAAAHSVTGAAPEEVMRGRKIRRRLPLLRPGKANFDDKVLESKDRWTKIEAKRREDSRRAARECHVKPGDTVIVERRARAKGDARFDQQRYTVMKEDNGSLTLCDESGQTTKRHVTQTRKVHRWRDESRNDNEDGHGIVPTTRRSAREKRAPAHLNDFIRVAEQMSM